MSFWCQDTRSFLPLSLLRVLSEEGKQHLGAANSPNKTRQGASPENGLVWLWSRRCRELPRSPSFTPGCRKHRLSPWHQGARAESAETWRYGDWPETGDQKSPGAILVLGPVQTSEVSLSDRTVLSSESRWARHRSPHPEADGAPVLSLCHSACPWSRSPRSTLPANITFSECEMWAVKPALSCFQGYLCNKLCKV